MCAALGSLAQAREPRRRLEPSVTGDQVQRKRSVGRSAKAGSGDGPPELLLPRTGTDPPPGPQGERGEETTDGDGFGRAAQLAVRVEAGRTRLRSRAALEPSRPSGLEEAASGRDRIVAHDNALFKLVVVPVGEPRHCVPENRNANATGDRGKHSARFAKLGAAAGRSSPGASGHGAAVRSRQSCNPG